MIHRSNAKQCHPELLKNFERRMCSQFLSTASGEQPPFTACRNFTLEMSSRPTRAPFVSSLMGLLVSQCPVLLISNFVR